MATTIVPLTNMLRLDFGVSDVTEYSTPPAAMPVRTEVPPTALAFDGAVNRLLRNTGPSGTVLEWILPQISDDSVLTVSGFNEGVADAIACMEQALKDSMSPDEAVPFKRALRHLKEMQTLRSEYRAMFSALMQG
jgi:hypothetical protein